MGKARKPRAEATTTIQSGDGGFAADSVRAKHFRFGHTYVNVFVSEAGTAAELVSRLESEPATAGDLLAELTGLVRKVKVPVKQLGQLYRDSLPPQATPVRSNKLGDILLDLSERPLLASNRLPLLDFVARLARLDAAARIRAELEAWLQRAGPAIVPSGTPVEIDVPAPPAVPPQAVLEVQLIPDPNNANRTKAKLYLIEVALWKSDLGYLPTFRSPLGNKPLLLDEVPAVLADVLENTAGFRTIDAVADVRFEFILPLDLLSHAVEHWKPQAGPVPSEDTYGTMNPVVVRCLDRMKHYATNAYTGTRLFNQWTDKWRAFRDQSAARDGTTLRWYHLNGQADQGQLIKALQDDDKAHCLGLPDPADERALAALIWAGVPVALWARAAPAAPGGSPLCDLLKSTLRGRTLAELPVSLRTARGAGGRSYPNNYLALLWDDPTRLPLRYRPDGVFRDEQLASVQG